jgi:hypothetical protein
MIQQRPLLLLASAGVLSLALGQALAEEAAPAAAAEPAAPAQPAPAPAAPAAADPAAAAEAMRAEMEKRYGEMEKRFQEAMAERNARYAELRKRATEAGLEMPETPPWERGGPMMGPGMPGPMGPGMMGPGMAGGEPGAEAPQPMTPEEAMEMRKQRWEAMRERAAEQGMELPETPPWEAAQQRRQEMLDRYNAYRATIEAMTDEQKEAIAALFGGVQRGGCRQSMRPMGGRPGYGMGPGGWGQPPQMPEMPSAPEMLQPPAPPAPPAAPAAE